MPPERAHTAEPGSTCRRRPATIVAISRSNQCARTRLCVSRQSLDSACQAHTDHLRNISLASTSRHFKFNGGCGILRFSPFRDNSGIIWLLPSPSLFSAVDICALCRGWESPIHRPAAWRRADWWPWDTCWRTSPRTATSRRCATSAP